jgi:hypothetical protein
VRTLFQETTDCIDIQIQSVIIQSVIDVKVLNQHHIDTTVCGSDIRFCIVTLTFDFNYFNLQQQYYINGNMVCHYCLDDCLNSLVVYMYVDCTRKCCMIEPVDIIVDAYRCTQLS